MPYAMHEVHKEGKGNGHQWPAEMQKQLQISDMGMTGHACASVSLVALWDSEMHDVSCTKAPRGASQMCLASAAMTRWSLHWTCMPVQ